MLWCDPDASFASVVPQLRLKLDRLHTLGPFDPAHRCGPAFELRAAAARAEAAGGSPPILWLPGVGRDIFKTPLGCPQELEPLLWLAASGAFFGHVNGKDWSLRAFLTAERGPVGLDIADGSEVREALATAAPQIFARPIEVLRGRRFDADALLALCAPDIAADILDWLEGRLQPTDQTRFKAFAGRARKELGFDPLKRSRTDAADALARHEGPWRAVWDRFADAAPYAYPETNRALAAAEPPSGMFGEEEGYPVVNERAETRLRSELGTLHKVDFATAREKIRALEGEHGGRRDTLWGLRGMAPLAEALGLLAEVANAPPWPNSDADGLAAFYFEHGVQVDCAALRAVEKAKAETDRAAVSVALQSIYLPWLDDGARRLQALAAVGQAPFGRIEPIPSKVGAVVFVDGLRLDLARRLVRRLEGLGANASLSWRWTGFPTSTSTCKPLVAPVADRVTGKGGEQSLTPVSAEGKAVAQPVLRKLLEADGWTFDAETGGRLWCELGNFDEDGHSLQIRLADQITQGLEDVARRLVEIAKSGRQIRVVTDHGWLLAPGGLPKVALGTGLVEPDQKRTRYARLKEGAATEHARAAWSWNPEVRLAMAPGASTFWPCEYAHGGVSLQECVIPVIDVAPLTEARGAHVAKAWWVQMRLRVEVDGGADLRVDLRAGSDGSGPSLVNHPKSLNENGQGSLLVSEEYEGETATVVVLDDGGRVLARSVVKVGG